MSVSSLPYLLQVGDTVSAVELIEEQPEEIMQSGNIPSNAVLFQVVYPEELNLKPVQMKRGRPKKKKPSETTALSTEKTMETPILPPPPCKAARTRSGRLIKTPKILEKDFKKIEISDEPEVKTTEFARTVDETPSDVPFNAGIESLQKKRNVAAQHRCPKCGKAYLGKNKMIQHLKKYPDHGPVPEYTNYNFDVWNYLVDVTQKCAPGQRGVKFCEELSNLIHNVQLLTSALFKSVTNNKNTVQIDKVLGNAIGLQPGKYNFDENELYKDVTVLQLITNSEFFNPNRPDKINCEEKEKVTENPEQKAASTDNYAVVNESPKKAEANGNLLGENPILNPSPNIRVDELMLPADETSSNLLDNSTSSDEVMNVDQFVNERFKKITEADIELSSSTLNLVDLPTLDLFHFHTN